MIKILSIGNTYILKGVHSTQDMTYSGYISSTPMESFHCIIQHRPDIIVFRTGLGSLEDITVYQRIRNMYAGRYVPIILLVHEEDENLYEDFYDDGITVGLCADIEEELLFLHIKQLVSRCRELKKNVLIVEDDPVVRNTYTLFLSEKYYVHEASSTSEAVTLLQTENVDVILLAAMRKNHTVLPFIKLVKESIKWKNIPIILQTEADNLEMVGELGDSITDCLLKPVARNILLEHLDNVLEPGLTKKELSISDGRKRILFVDKQGVNYTSLKNVLEHHYENIHALPGVRPVSLLESEQIDGVLVNVDTSSFCLNKIMDKAQQKNIPVLLMTSDIENINNVLDEKVTHSSCIEGILSLPITKQLLLDKLELAI